MLNKFFQSLKNNVDHNRRHKTIIQCGAEPTPNMCPLLKMEEVVASSRNDDGPELDQSSPFKRLTGSQCLAFKTKRMKRERGIEAAAKVAKNARLGHCAAPDGPFLDDDQNYFRP